MKSKLFSSKFIRFGLVGSFNFLVDYLIFNILLLAKIYPVVANLISTGIAVIVSYFLNKYFVFGKKRGLFLSFFIVTITGVWVLQSLIISLSLATLKLISLHQYSTHLIFFSDVFKILSTFVSLIWNFTLYNNVVFKGKKSTD